MDLLSQRHDRPRAARPKTESNRWTVPDLIDFDYYIDEDERAVRERHTERKRLAERDRGLYLERIRDATPKSAPEHSPRHRSTALRLWLEQQRGAEDAALRPLLPGASFVRGQRLVTIGLGVTGWVMGAGVVSALLQYDGTHPVNIAWYLFVLVLLQTLLAAITIGVWALRGSSPVRAAAEDVSLLSHLIRPLFSRVAGWVQRQRLALVPAEVRDRAAARTGLLQSHYTLYGPASYLPILIAAQVFGIGFNLGAVVTTVGLEWFSDLAFGWGSALDVQPRTIHDLARLIALPWSWIFGEGIGYPNLEQVAGSRISLKDPLATLNAGDLRAWRWFLVLAVTTYGLLPRVLLLGLSLLNQRRTLSALPFTHQRTQALYARMVTPSLETAIAGSGTGPEMPIPPPLKPLRAPTAAPRPTPGRKARPADQPVPEPTIAKRTAGAPVAAPGDQPQDARNGATRGQAKAGQAHGAKPAALRTAREVPPTAPITTIDADACVLMIHLDVADVLHDSDHARLQRMLLAHTGWRVAASVTIGGGSAMTDQAVALVRSAQWEAPPPRIAIIQDGSQPPITEQLRFLRSIRAAAGDQAPLLLALVGDPEDEDPLPPLSDFDLEDWQRKTDQMGDPYLRLEMLAPPASDPAPTAEESR